MERHFFPYLGRFAHPLRTLLLLTTMLTVQDSFAQIESLWDRSFGGAGWEELNSAEETADGGFILAGYSSSPIDGDVTFDNEGIGDFWILKTDALGDKEWDARFGGTELDRCNAVIQTADGGYLLGGVSASGESGQKQTPNHGMDDYWVVKTDGLGNLEWEQTYGGTDLEILYDIIQMPDGGYVLSGMSASDVGFEKSEPNLGGFDYWIVKIDAAGNYEWDKTLGGAAEERLNEIEVAPDGNLLLAGSTQSGVGDDVTVAPVGIKDFWFVKVSGVDGSLIWQHRFGGANVEELIDFEQTLDGGYFLVGGSNSDASPWKTENARGGSTDMWGLKIDAAGNYQWDVTFGGGELDNCYALKENAAGYFMMGGFSGSPAGGDKTESNRGGWDFWVLYLDENGNKIWDRTIGGSQNDVLFNLFQNSDGGYILAGASDSPISGDKTFDTNGLNDFWLVKTVCDLELTFRDTLVCPGQPLAINAFQNQDCDNCLYDWEDIGRGDSIRMITTTVDEIYRVTITDNTGCQKTDELSITILDVPTVDLGSNVQICEGANTTLTAAGVADTYLWSADNQTSPAIQIDNAGRYFVTVTNALGCTAVDSVDVEINPLPVVDLGPDTVLCSGQPLTLDAQNPGSDYTWFPVGNNQVETFNLNDAMTIHVGVEDDNNCIGRDTIEVLGVYDAPVVTDTTISCSADNNTYTVSFTIVGGDAATYAVSGEIDVVQTGSQFVSAPINREEAFSFSITDGQNCTPFILTGMGVCPCATQAGTANTNMVEICGNETITISFDGQFLDGNDTVNYLFHDGDANTIGNVLLQSTTPEIVYSPIFLQNTTYYCTAIVGNDDGAGIVNPNDGCYAQAQGFPVIFYPSPEAVIISQGGLELSCNQASIVLNGGDSQPVGGLEFDWSTVGGNIEGDTGSMSVEGDAAGWYQLIVQTTGTTCRDTAGVELTTAADFPVLDILPFGELTCVDTTVVLDAGNSSQGSNFMAEWTGSGIGGQTGLVQTINAPGTYQLAIINTDSNCRDSLAITVLENTTPPNIDAGGLAALDCATGTAVLSGQVNPPTVDYTINWTTADGNFVDMPHSLEPEVDAVGTYTLAVTDVNNGCVATDNVVVGADPDGPTDVWFSAQPPTCFGENDGLIVLDSVAGGERPYLISMDGAAFSTTLTYPRLLAGTYDFVVQDVNGCTFETSVTLENPDVLIAFLGDDETIQLGDSVRLQASFNNPIDTFFWNDTTFLSCTDCLNPAARPLRTSRLVLTGIDVHGCLQSDTIQINVRKERLVYIPSAFSPNGDGLNDHFIVHAGQGVSRIASVRIFNRWGAVVFDVANVQPDDYRTSWNGSFKGEAMQTGVYVYVVRVVFDDGEEVLYRGDVTMVR